MAKTNKKRILSAVSFAVSLAIFAFALAVFIITMQAKAKNRPAELFGYSFAVVVTGSMRPEINVGDLIIVKSCKITDMEVGQNAVFIGTKDEYKDKCIVHRVIGRADPDEEEFYLITQGLTNTDPDPYVTAEYFIGREIYHSAALGTIVLFLQNPVNWVYMIVIIGCIVVFATQLTKIIKHAKGKDKAEGKDEGNKEE